MENAKQNDAGPSSDSLPRLILAVEDEPQVMRFLRVSLPAHGYRLVEAATGESGLTEAATHPPDLILLDLGLPDLDGIEVTRRLRTWSTTPIIVISARGREEDKVEALDAGADDYLTKPFGVPELLARIRVALRNAARIETGSGQSVLDVGDLHVDLGRRQVTVKATEIHLTRTEFNLLAVFAKHAGRVLTHHQLLHDVWGPGATEHHYLRVYMAQLRHKLEPDPARPRYLLTEAGVGYRLRPD